MFTSVRKFAAVTLWPDCDLVWLISEAVTEPFPFGIAEQDADGHRDAAGGIAGGISHVFQGEGEALAIGHTGKLKDFAENPLYLSWAGNVYGAAQRKDEAEKVINQLIELSHRTDVSPMYFAIVYAGMGEKDLVFKWFEKVFEERAPWGAISLKGSPLFDSLRSAPRFADLLRRANLVP